LRVFPPEPATDERAYLVCVPERLLPLFCGALKTLEEREAWASDDDWRLGYQWIVETQANLMNNCIDKLVESNNQIYRLLDTVFNGTPYSVDAFTGSVVPDIPVAPTAAAAGVGVGFGLRKQLLDMQGVLPSGWPFGFGNKPATIGDLVRAMRNDSPAQINRTKDALTALAAAAQGATIFDVVEGFIADGADVVEEGGILIAVLVGIMSNAAFMGIQAGQLDDLLEKMDRLIKSLDGGATPAPADNVLSTLQAVETLLG
jgi:hypothetical protein